MVTEFYYPHLGGVCEHVHFLSRELRRRGWQVDILTGGMRGQKEDPNVLRLGRSVSVYANGSHARFTVGLRLREQLRTALRVGDYDLVHVHSPLAPVLPLLALEEAECPVVGTFHTPLGRHPAYALGKACFQRRMDRLAAAVAVSPAAAAGFDRYFRVRWEFIPNGVDTDLFRPDAERPPELDGEAATILFLGRLDPRNELGTALKAFSLLRKAVREPLRLVVVGGGPLRPLYEFRARGRGDIRFVGPILSGRPGYYSHSSVYVCPTTRGTFGITLLEALACGTPVVCSDLPGFRHVVREGREGLFHPLRDSVSLAEQVLLLLEDERLRERMGVAARKRALTFSWSHVTDRVLDLYERVLGAQAR